MLSYIDLLKNTVSKQKHNSTQGYQRGESGIRSLFVSITHSAETSSKLKENRGHEIIIFLLEAAAIRHRDFVSQGHPVISDALIFS